ncbi:MAG: hypothetical protein ACPGQL_06230 [Thermoplasmatota archaeon]
MADVSLLRQANLVGITILASSLFFMLPHAIKNLNHFPARNLEEVGVTLIVLGTIASLMARVAVRTIVATTTRKLDGSTMWMANLDVRFRWLEHATFKNFLLPLSLEMLQLISVASLLILSVLDIVEIPRLLVIALVIFFFLGVASIVYYAKGRPGAFLSQMNLATLTAQSGPAPGVTALVTKARSAEDLPWLAIIQRKLLAGIGRLSRIGHLAIEAFVVLAAAYSIASISGINSTSRLPWATFEFLLWALALAAILAVGFALFITSRLDTIRCLDWLVVEGLSGHLNDEEFERVYVAVILARWMNIAHPLSIIPLAVAKD